MKIMLMASKAFENQRMLMDLNGAVNFAKDKNMFMKNNEVGVYDIERFKVAMKPEEKEEFWNKVKEIMEPTYDVEIKDETFFVYKKGAKATDKLTNIDEDDKKNDNKRHEEATEQPTKAPTKRKVSTKSKKVQGDK